MQQAYLSPASDQEFNAKLEALKASTGAPAKLSVRKGVSPLDDGAVTSAATSHRTCRVREVVPYTHTSEVGWRGHRAGSTRLSGVETPRACLSHPFAENCPHSARDVHSTTTASSRGGGGGGCCTGALLEGAAAATSVDDEKDNSRLPLQIGAVLIVRV